MNESEMVFFYSGPDEVCLNCAQQILTNQHGTLRSPPTNLRYDIEDIKNQQVRCYGAALSKSAGT